ncbi:MAG: D-alanyl-D-alanine carboxypeptidase [Spirochaetaceae bacterium]|jgi:D-alanyl-D-alanine carboxypeptidase (penicillin-binding protein 5/6)|nr:D-alanyl-D-alanine carboxypeptidase [Spirochaetaceae bacterium]
MIKKKQVKINYGLILFLGCFTAAALFPLDPADDVPELSARSAVLMDAQTGAVLYAKNADEPIPPASLTKLMTIHLAQKLAAERNISLDDPVDLPRESWAVNQAPRSSLMNLAQGQRVSLRELFLGLAIPSGNDAAVAVALNFAPTISDFAALMNDEAAKLGLKSTTFVEPSGISEDNWTTAMEFSKFCLYYLQKHPENIKNYHSVREFAYPKPENVPSVALDRVRTLVKTNHIGLLDTYPGVDGLKTGYIDESGYNLALTAEQNDTRFIVVILGVPAELGAVRGARVRDADGQALLDWGFNHFKTIKPVFPVIPQAKVWKGKQNYAELVSIPKLSGNSQNAITVTVDRGNDLRWEFVINDIIAPQARGDFAGNLILYDSLGEIENLNLVTVDEVEKGFFLKRFWHSIVLFFKSLFA